MCYAHNSEQDLNEKSQPTTTPFILLWFLAL